MAEVFICAIGAVTPKSIRDLRKAGVVVVETSEPERCQFVRSGEVVSADDLLWAAMSALNNKGYGGGDQREAFAKRVYELVEAAHQTKVAKPSVEPPE
jgi:hypothetical protein